MLSRSKKEKKNITNAKSSKYRIRNKIDIIMLTFTQRKITLFDHREMNTHTELRFKIQMTEYWKYDTGNKMVLT